MKHRAVAMAGSTPARTDAAGPEHAPQPAGVPRFLQRQATSSRPRTSSADAAPGGTAVQMKCACGGGSPCAACAEKDERLQHKADGVAAAGVPLHSVARRGVEAAHEPLPYRDRIQASFGRRDIRGVKARVGGDAAGANERMGSLGYTVGDRVGFRSSPDVRLAAHEAAHVVQQHEGVHLAGGVGTPGDVYEQQADAVAEAVARGESAEPIFERFPATPAITAVNPRAAVQHKLAVSATRLFEDEVEPSRADGGGAGTVPAAARGGVEGGEPAAGQGPTDQAAADGNAGEAAPAPAAAATAAASGGGADAARADTDRQAAAHDPRIDRSSSSNDGGTPSPGGGPSPGGAATSAGTPVPGASSSTSPAGAPAAAAGADASNAPGGGGGTATAASSGPRCAGSTEATCYDKPSDQPAKEPEETPANPEATKTKEETSDAGEEDAPEPDNCTPPAAAGGPPAAGGAASPGGGAAPAVTSEGAAAGGAPAAAGPGGAPGGGQGPGGTASNASGSGSAHAGGGSPAGGGGGAAAPMQSGGSPMDGAIAAAESQRDAAVGTYATSAAALAAAGEANSALRGRVAFASAGGETAALSIQRDESSQRATRFLSSAADQIEHALAFVSEEVPERLGAEADAAKTEIATSMESQKSAISARIEAARKQARSDAAVARGEVAAQAAAFIAEARTESAGAIKALATAHDEATAALTGLETTTLGQINEKYAAGRVELEALGTTIGGEATATGETYATTYKGFRDCTAATETFWDGNLSERRSEAQENAARSTAKGYHDRIVESARKRAREITKAGRKEDRCTILGAASAARDNLASMLAGLVSALEGARDQSIQQAGSTRDSLISSINDSLATTLRQLDQQEHDQRQTADDTGYLQQVLQEQIAHAGAAALQRVVAGASTTLQSTLGQVQSLFAQNRAPNPAVLDERLASAEQRLSAAMGGLMDSVNGGLSLASGQLAAAAREGLASLEQVSQGNDKAATSLGGGFTASMSQIAGTDNFAAQRGAFSQLVQKTATDGTGAMAKVVNGMSTGCTDTLTGADTKLKTGREGLSKNLRDGMQGLECDITAKATEAASHEAPRWKRWLAVFLIILVVIIIVAVIVVTAGGAAGPLAALIAAVGPVATGAIVGAVVGAVTSALITMATDLWSNRSLSLSRTLKAAAIGFVTGAIGGAAGAWVGGALKGFSLVVQYGAAMALSGGLDVVTQFVMGGLSFEHFSWANLGLTLLVTALTLGLAHRVAAARVTPPAPPPASRRMGTVSAGPEGIVEHAPSSPVVERAPAGRRSLSTEPEASAGPAKRVDTPEPSQRSGSTSEEINEVIAEETKAPPERTPADTPEGPEPGAAPTDTADPKAARNRAELEAELGRRDLLDDPTFQGMDAQTEGKVNTALKGDPIAKASESTRLRTQEWARRAAGGDPREFANRYEYARARFTEARAAAAVRLKGQPNSKAAAITAAEAEIAPARLDERLAADIEASRSLGRGQRLQDIRVKASPEATPRQIADAVQKLDRVGFESETAEAYHAVKHGEELPPAMRSGDAVRQYAAAATDTIRTGRVVVAAPSGESTLVVIHQTYGAPPNVRVLEAIIYVGRDGSVTLASYGAPKFKL